MNNLQSFLPGANHWLGRGPKSALARLTTQAQGAALSSLSELSLLFSSFIPMALLQPNEAKHHSRRRIYSLRCTFWAFLAQVLTPQTSCIEVVKKVQSFCSAHALPLPRGGSSAYCQARQKLDKTAYLVFINTWPRPWSNAHRGNGFGGRERSSWWMEPASSCPTPRTTNKPILNLHNSATVVVFRSCR